MPAKEMLDHRLDFILFHARPYCLHSFDVSFGVDFSKVADPKQAFFLTVNQGPTVTAQIVAPIGGIAAGLELDAGSLGKLLDLSAQVNGTVNNAGGRPRMGSMNRRSMETSLGADASAQSVEARGIGGSV